MISGCLDWQLHGLVRPASIAEATDAYFSEQDLFGQWLDDKCDVEKDNLSKWERRASFLHPGGFMPKRRATMQAT